MANRSPFSLTLCPLPDKIWGKLWGRTTSFSGQNGDKSNFRGGNWTYPHFLRTIKNEMTMKMQK